MDTDLRTLCMSVHPVKRSGRKVVRVEELDMLADVPKAACMKTDPATLDKGTRSSGAGQVRQPPRAERSELRHVTLTVSYAARAGAALQIHSLGEFNASSHGHRVFNYDCCKLIMDRKWGICRHGFLLHGVQWNRTRERV